MGIENLAEDLLNEPEEEKKSSALRAPPLGKEEKEKKEPKLPGSVEDDVIEGQWRIKDEIQELQLRIVEGKKSKPQNLAEFQKELSLAKQESEEWKKLLNLAREKRKPTVAEAAVLKEERLVALAKAAEAAKSAGVENLESVETELREADAAIQNPEPRQRGEMRHELQARETALREKQRLLQEARFWLKKATIIQALMEREKGLEHAPKASK